MSEAKRLPAKALTVEALTKCYDRTAAVDAVTFATRPGALVTLLGPSGCGKTTTLRMIGGLVEPDAGRIVIGERDVTDQPPWKRNCGFVFQSYALFPHMSVRDNIAYGLTVRGWTPAAIRRKVAEVAELMDISALIERAPRELSGGQQQRCAVARALAIEPDILLMDEPLANLDAQLRERIRAEVRRLQTELGITVVYVTHDQSEAFAISDEILVMKAGRIVQRGRPQDIFSRPNDAYVASFVGTNNLIAADVVVVDGARVDLTWGPFRVSGRAEETPQVGERVTAVVGAQCFEIASELEAPDGGPSLDRIEGRVEELAFLGGHYRIVLETAAGAVTVDLGQRAVEQRGIALGSRLALHITDAFLIRDNGSGASSQMRTDRQ